MGLRSWGPSYTEVGSLVCDLCQQHPRAHRAQPCHEARSTPLPALFPAPHESYTAIRPEVGASKWSPGFQVSRKL